ncbi:MAG: hypothetical protein F6K10_29805 [Moorea sp. SIO2B7]|nr:hypothetical protein [Moorena sp. SIO2B7]
MVTAETKEELIEVLGQTKAWLLERGLEISDEKTRIVHISEGFKFLSFNIIMFGQGKKETLLTKPEKKNILSFCQEIGRIIKTFNGKSQEELIKKLNPILRGKANYYKHCTSKKVFK